MEMFLTIACLSLIGVVVSAALFAAAMPRQQDVQAAPDAVRVIHTGRFFADEGRREMPLNVPIPVELLLLQIERHIRLEQAAAESFHWSPTAEALHMHTSSPLVH